MTENNAAQPGQDPIYDAIFLLTEEADSLSECHTRTPDDWTGEPEAKARYDHILSVVSALSKLRAEGVQAGDEVEWAGYRPLLRDAIAAKDAMHEAGIQYAKFGVMFPEMMRRYAAALASAPLADTLPLEKALYELVDKIAPGLDTGDLVQDARRASTLLGVIMASAPVAGEAQITDDDVLDILAEYGEHHTEHGRIVFDKWTLQAAGEALLQRCRAGKDGENGK